MAIKEYVHTGECIWCKRKKPYVTFFTAPHIVPKSLGGTEIGFDICDDCNKYFGKCTSENKAISIDLAFKEVFNACINSLGDGAEKLMPYSSALFHYNRAEDKIKLNAHSHSLILLNNSNVLSTKYFYKNTIKLSLMKI